MLLFVVDHITTGVIVNRQNASGRKKPAYCAVLRGRGKTKISQSRGGAALTDKTGVNGPK